MSIAHLEKLRKELEGNHWIIEKEESNSHLYYWKISRPNGDMPLTIEFSIGGRGLYGAIDDSETIEDAIACNIETHEEIEVYFGKFSGGFQKDIKNFVSQICNLDSKKK